MPHDPQQTKWKRLHFAFAEYQNTNQRSDNILRYIKYALEPAKYVNRQEEFENIRKSINQQLAFIGYCYNENGTISEVKQATTISEAQQRANNLKTKLEERSTHIKILQYCKAELLVDNYFHSVFEANKGLLDRVRELSYYDKDGVNLIEHVFSIKDPILIINNFTTESEKNEHIGFCSILKGMCSMFRNTTAHELKIK